MAVKPIKKTFVTLVTHIDNIELRKDTGQIPYHFFKLGYDARLVTYYYKLNGGRTAGPVANPPRDRESINRDYPFLTSEVNGLKIDFIEDLGRGKFYEKSVLKYLKENAKKIDILHLFHFSSQTIFYTLVYKSLNPKGKVYLKLDISIGFYETQHSIFNTVGRLNQIKNILYSNTIIPIFFKLVTLISAESEQGLQYFKNRFHLKDRKIALIPNCVDQKRFYALSNGLNKFEEKENIILSVGVIGDKNKNHILLLKAIPKINLANWTFFFIGSITKDFEKEISLFYKDNPKLKDQVKFTGEIKDSAILCDFYNRSKIFCMPSKSEGFPISAVEAATFGNILLLNESIYAFNTLTNNGSNGFQFNDKNIHTVFNSILINAPLQKKMYQNIIPYAQKNFSWARTILKLDHLLS